jgi:formylglycine-generating enzyme required for sulfatase activity
MDRIIQDATAENKDERLESIDQLRKALLNAIRELKSDREAALSVKSDRVPAIYKPGWIWSGVILTLVAVVAMTIWHLVGNPGASNVALKSPPEVSRNSAEEAGRESSALELAESEHPKQAILTEDGATMHFVEAGVVIIQAGPDLPERSVKVNSFYMDETLVTNHQFVEFLNQNLSKIRVERGVVRVEDEIWLLMGEVKEDYNPIVYQKGQFKVSSVAYASFPVLRVTAYGASSYARFYNRRLPIYTEWLHAKGGKNEIMEEIVHDGAAGDQEMDMASMHEMHTRGKSSTSMPESFESKLSPVTNYQPNKYGIRGLNKNIKEWGLLLSPATSRDKIRDADFAVLPSTTRRYPWEGFEEVGFRCIREVVIKAN